MINFKILIQKRFLVYSIMLHACIGVAFAALNGSDENEDKDNNEVRIIEIDVSAPQEDTSIIAETFSEDDIQDELDDIIEYNQNVTVESRLKQAELKEKRKAEAAKIKQKEKEKLIKEKKRLQREKQEIARKKAEKEKQRKLEAEKKRQIEAEKQRKLKAEKKRQEEAEKRRKAEAEKQRKLEIERKKKAEQEKIARNKKLQESKPKVLTKNQWLETSDGQSAYYQYGNSVMSKIQNRWIRPVEALSGWYCELEITQTSKGRISGIKKIKCDPNNQKFYNSVYKAVMESSPLPLPRDERLFDKKIKITFKVE